MNNNTNGNDKFGEIIKLLDIVRALAGLVGVASLLYVFGFIIVNIDLASKGVRNFELAKPTYISAGTIFAFVTLFLVLLTAFSVDRLARFRMSKISLQEVIKFFLILLVVGILFLAFRIIFGVLDIEVIFLPGYTLFVVFITLLVVLVGRQLVVSFIEGDWIVWGLGSTVVIFVFLLFAYFWGIQIYPLLTPEFGGGSQISVQLTRRANVPQDLFAEAGIEFEGDYLTKALYLIDLTDKTLIVQDPLSLRAITIDRSLIAKIIFLTKSMEPIILSPPTSTLTPTPLPTLTPTATITPEVKTQTCQFENQKQNVRWQPSGPGYQVGVCILSEGASCAEFIPWSDIKIEIETQIIPKTAFIPPGSQAVLGSAKGNEIIFIQTPSQVSIGNIWFGLNPTLNRSPDEGIIYITDSRDPTIVWETFQRNSDNSYCKDL